MIHTLTTSPIAPYTIVVALAAVAALGYGIGVLREHRTARRRPTLKIELVRGDITTMQVDAIVNAAKSSLLGGGGVDGAIHRAGGPAILRECRILRETLPPFGLLAGQAVVTTAGDLPAEHVIHTVGPVWNPDRDQVAILRSCYTESLAAADRHDARTVAFPLISSGVYGWPKDDAIVQALEALRSARPWTRVETARLVMFDEDTYRTAQNLMAQN